MAETVGQHQQSAYVTPVNGGTGDATVVLGNDNNTRTKLNAHDADTGVHVQSSVLASRPAFGSVGRKWLCSDTLKLYYDTGAAWAEVAYAPAVAPSFTGGITVAGGAVIGGGANITGNSAITGTLNVSGLAVFAAGLELTGTIKLGGRTYTFPVAEVANGYLKTNGTGTLAFVALPHVPTASAVMVGHTTDQDFPYGEDTTLLPNGTPLVSGTGLTYNAGTGFVTNASGVDGIVHVTVSGHFGDTGTNENWQVILWASGGGTNVVPAHHPMLRANGTMVGSTTSFLVYLSAGASLCVDVINPTALLRKLQFSLFFSMVA